MSRFRAVALASIVASSLLLVGEGKPVALSAEPKVTLLAYLDGSPIPIGDVSKYYCDDFAYPVITCSVSPIVQASRASVFSLLASIDYVSIYELPSYSGATMNISQDYTALLLIGWNDKISSFRGRNGETGRFFTDWLYSGSQWSFCCNTLQPSLGGYDNTFSSVQRT